MIGRPRSLVVAWCLASLVAVALLVSACGNTAIRRSRPLVVHLDGKVTGDYVRETSATGVGFLVPTAVLADQGAQTFEIAAPLPQGNPNVVQIGPKITSVSEWEKQRWWTGPIVQGMAPQGAHVELLASGEPGLRFYLEFEETCGMVDGGRSHLGVSNGATGQRIMRSPAVMTVPALQASPKTSCYVSGVVMSRGGRNHLHLSLIDY
jgi:hypothetical protein